MRRQHRRFRARRRERVAKRKRIHDRRQHPHVVGGNPIKAGGLEFRPPNKIAASDYHGNLSHLTPFRVTGDHGDNVLGRAFEDHCIDPGAGRSAQRFPREFHHEARSLANSACVWRK